MKSIEQQRAVYYAELDKSEREREERHEAFLQRERRKAELFQPFSPAFLSHGAWPAEFLIEGFLPQGYLVNLAARPKLGKTCLATSIALAVATGQPFAGMATRQRSVLWLSLEESPEERALLLRKWTPPSTPIAAVELDEAMHPLGGYGPGVPLFTCFHRLRIDRDDDLSMLSDWVRDVDAGLIVVDPLLAAIGNGQLNLPEVARKSLQGMKDLCTAHRISAIVLHHTKNYWFSTQQVAAGNDQLAATASMEWVYDRVSAGTGSLVTLQGRGRGAFANGTWQFMSYGELDYRLMRDRTLEGLGSVPAALVRQTGALQSASELAFLRELAKGPATVTEVRSRCPEIDLHLGSWYQVVRRLLRRGQVEVVGKRGWARVYGLV